MFAQAKVGGPTAWDEALSFAAMLSLGDAMIWLG
jgi:hypothetical protein